MSAQSVLEFDWPEETRPEWASASVTDGVELDRAQVTVEPLDRLAALAAAWNRRRAESVALPDGRVRAAPAPARGEQSRHGRAGCSIVV